MVSSVAGPRVLLRRLREVMAEPESAQKRLEKVSVAIAANMVAEVCSVYLVRPDNSLELFATEGLNPDAVHKTFLNTGEGLVGLIAAEAETLSLSDAHSHPAFAYRPETGEDVRSSACRSSGSAGPLVCWWCKTAPSALTVKKKWKFCKPPPWCWRK